MTNTAATAAPVAMPAMAAVESAGGAGVGSSLATSSSAVAFPDGDGVSVGDTEPMWTHSVSISLVDAVDDAMPAVCDSDGDSVLLGVVVDVDVCVADVDDDAELECERVRDSDVDRVAVFDGEAPCVRLGVGVRVFDGVRDGVSDSDSDVVAVLVGDVVVDVDALALDVGVAVSLVLDDGVALVLSVSLVDAVTDGDGVGVFDAYTQLPHRMVRFQRPVHGS
jgi:hypothetical protein